MRLIFATAFILGAFPLISYACERCEAFGDHVYCQYGFNVGGQTCHTNVDSCFTLGSCDDDSLPPFPPWSPPLPPDWPWYPGFPPNDWPIDPTGTGLLPLYDGDTAECRVSRCDNQERIIYTGFRPAYLDTVSQHSVLLGKVLEILRSPEAGGLPMSTVPSGIFVKEDGSIVHFRGQIAMGKDLEFQVYFEFFGHPEISSILAVLSSSDRHLVGSINKTMLDGQRVSTDF